VVNGREDIALFSSVTLTANPVRPQKPSAQNSAVSLVFFFALFFPRTVIRYFVFFSQQFVAGSGHSGQPKAARNNFISHLLVMLRTLTFFFSKRSNAALFVSPLLFESVVRNYVNNACEVSVETGPATPMIFVFGSFSPGNGTGPVPQTVCVCSASVCGGPLPNLLYKDHPLPARNSHTANLVAVY